MGTWEIGDIDNSDIGTQTAAKGYFTELKAGTDPVDGSGVGDRAYNDGRYSPTGVTYGAHSILKADSYNNPILLTVHEQTLVGRITGNVIDDLSPAQVRTLINVADGADVTASNTAANISGQGALATKNTADFATEVSGAAKPASNADVTANNAPQAHKDSHDPNDGSDALDTASAAELVGVQGAGTGASHSFARADHIHQIQHSIADNHLVTIDHASVADDDYAKFTSGGLEGRSSSEVKSDLGYITELVDDTSPQLGGDLDGQGNYLVGVQNIPDLASKGSGYYFDGVDDAITIADDDNLSFGNGTSDTPFSIICNSNLKKHGTAENIFSKGSISKREYFFGFYPENYLSLFLYDDNSGNSIISTTDNEIDVNTNTTIGATYAGLGVNTDILLYVNGGLISSTPGGLGTYVAMHNQSYSANICRWFSDGSDYTNIEIFFLYVFNLKISSEEMKAFSSGASVPYKYLGANQTNIITLSNDQDFNAGNIGNWYLVTDGNGTCNYDAGPGAVETAMITVGTTPGTYTQGRLNTSNCTTIIPGKRYCLKADVYIPSANNNFSGVGIRFGGLSDNIDTITVLANLALEDQWQTIQEITTIQQDISGYLTFIVGSTTAGDIAYFDNITLTQVGCVLQLEQSDIGYNQWLDTSGNELHGTVSGALPINLPANNVERFRHTVAITDDTTWTDIVPAGYILESIIFVESAGNTAILDLGTTATGQDVFEQQTITASSITTISINKIFSMTVNQSLYLNDDGTGTWNGASITATLLMRRVI